MYSFKNIISFVKNNSPVQKIKNYFFWKKFLNQATIKCKIIDSESDLDIYIIAFNNADLIFNQIFFLKRNLKDKYRLIIIDNSNNTSKSQEIENICTKNKTSYVKLPENRLKASHSHALSLNYTMKNIALQQKTKYIWFLDHDCFLIKPISIVNILKEQPLYWKLMEPILLNIFWSKLNISWKRWVIRPWCAFYDKTLFNKGYNFFPNKQLLPLSFLDTGWWNWKYIYKNYNINNLKLLHSKIPEIQWTDNIWDIFIHLSWAGYINNKITNEKCKALYISYS